MKKILLGLGLVLSAASLSAQAQNSAESNSAASSQTAVQASNAGNQLGVQQTYNSGGETTYRGHILSNPGAPLGGSAAGFSNNNCANTAQKSVSVMVASGASADPYESKGCNYRQNAGTFYTAASVRASLGQQARADALMAMGDVAACRAEAEMDKTDMDNCKLLGIVGDRDEAKLFQPSATTTQPPPTTLGKPVTKPDFSDSTSPKQEKVATILVHP